MKFASVSLLLAVAYFLSGQASFAMAVNSGVVTPVLFAAEGFALAGAILYGPKAWFGIFAGQFALAAFNGLNLPATAAISAFNATEALLGAYLFARMNCSVSLGRVRDLLVLFVLILFVLQPFSATLGTQALLITGVIPDQSAVWDSWVSWWVGNSAGQLIICPAVLMLASQLQHVKDRFAQTLLSAMGSLVLAYFVLFQPNWSSLSAALVVFTPWLIGAGIFSGLFGVCVSGLIVVMSALYATASGTGPFIINDQARLFDLNVFILGIAMTAQLVAVIFEERRKTESALIFAKQQAESASRAKSAFLANLSHEIRTPLTALLGTTEIAFKNQRLPEEVRHDLFQANQSGKGLLQLLNNLLEYAKEEAGASHYLSDKVDLKDTLLRTLSLFESVAVDKGLSLRIQIDSDRIPQEVLGDGVKLQQIISNLTGNAIKFSERGSIELKVSKSDDQQFLIICVEDEGTGISAEHFDSIFKPFEQTQATQYQGTGLGLAISRQLARGMGGDLTVMSHPGKGSAFTLKLPLRPFPSSIGNPMLIRGTLKQARFAMDSLQTPDQLKPRLQGMRVLIVDDVVLNARIAAKFLEKEGAQVEIANSGREALSKLAGSSARSFKAVLMDLQMPDMNGAECVAQFRRAHPENQHLPFFGFTANLIDEASRQKDYPAFCAFISKPVDIEQAVKALLEHTTRFSKGLSTDRGTG